MECGKWYTLGNGKKRMLVKLILGHDAGKIIAISDEGRQSGIYQSEANALSRYEGNSFGGVFEIKESKLEAGCIITIADGSKRLLIRDERIVRAVNPKNYTVTGCFDSMEELTDFYTIIDVKKVKL